MLVPCLGLPYRILNINPKKELLWSLWVGFGEAHIAAEYGFWFGCISGLGLYGFKAVCGSEIRVRA